MRKPGLLRETERYQMFENAGLNVVQGANVISVDVQPEYQNYLGFDLFKYLQYLNENHDSMTSLTFLYNGSETMDMVTESEYQQWLLEYGLDEQIVYDSRFYDKGYAFFRYCMDENIAEQDIVVLIQYMIRNEINDSRDIDAEMWQDFVRYSGADESEVRDLLESADDMVNIPDLMEFLKSYGGKIMLTGGGIEQCLKEVEIALLALKKPYNVLTQFTY